MLKKSSIIIMAAIILFTVNPSMAASPWQDKESGGNASAVANSTGIGVGIGVGIAGAKSDATAIGIQNTEVRNSISSSNWNLNSVTTKQGQDQNQAQGIYAPLTAKTDLSIVNEKPDRDLLSVPGYQAPAPGDYRGPYERGVYGKLTPWSKKTTWTKADLKDYPAAGTLTKGLTAVLEPVESFTIVSKSGKAWIGDLVNEGDKGDAPSAVWGKVAKAALEAGCEEVVIVGSYTAFLNSGSGWNIGLGGGFSATNGGADNYGGSVGAGSGYGSFKVGPHEKVAFGADCYGNAANVKKGFFD